MSRACHIPSFPSLINICPTSHTTPTPFYFFFEVASVNSDISEIQSIHWWGYEYRRDCGDAAYLFLGASWCSHPSSRCLCPVPGAQTAFAFASLWPHLQVRAQVLFIRISELLLALNEYFDFPGCWRSKTGSGSGGWMMHRAKGRLKISPLKTGGLSLNRHGVILSQFFFFFLRDVTKSNFLALYLKNKPWKFKWGRNG